MTWLGDIVAPLIFRNGTEHSPRREKLDFAEGAGMTINVTDEPGGITKLEFIASTTVDPVITRITPPALASSQDNYSPTGWSTANTTRLSSSVDVDIRGFDSTVTIERRIVYNVGAKTITLKFNDLTQSAGNKIVTPLGADFDLSPGEGMIIEKDPTSSAWRVIETVNAGVLLSTSFAGEVVQHGDVVDNVLTSGAPTDGGAWHSELKVNATGLTVKSTATPTTPAANDTRVFGTSGGLRSRDPEGVIADVVKRGTVTKLVESGKRRWDIGPSTTQVFSNVVAVPLADDQFLVAWAVVTTFPVVTAEINENSTRGPSVNRKQFLVKAWRGLTGGTPNAMTATGASRNEWDEFEDTSAPSSDLTPTYDGGTNELRIAIDKGTAANGHASLSLEYDIFSADLTGGYAATPP